MSSQRYSEARSFREESRGGTDGFDSPYTQQRVNVPIQHSSKDLSHNVNEERVHDRLRHSDTTVQWVNDPISGKEKFRVYINIEGFSQNEVNIRVDGNKLLVYGEHSENKNDSTAKKIIEKSFELPRDIDTFSPHVTFPTSAKMQVDFPSRHLNAIIDDGRTSSNLISNYNTSHRSPPGFTQQKSSTEYTSTRKVGGGSGGINYERTSSPRSHSPYDQVYSGNNVGRASTYSSASLNQSRDHQGSIRGGFGDSKLDSFNISSSPTHTYRVTTGDSQPKTTFPSSLRDNSGSVKEQTFTESHHEVTHRRSSPTTGVQSSHEVEHHRSGSPSIAKSLDDDCFRSSIRLGDTSIIPPLSTRIDEDRFRSSVRLGDRSIIPPSSSTRLEEDRFQSNVRLGDRTIIPPSLSTHIDEDRFRSNVRFDDRNIIPPSSSTHIEEDRFQSNVRLGDRSIIPPSSSARLDEDRFRSNVRLGNRNIIPPSSSISSTRDEEDRFRSSVRLGDRSIIPPSSTRDVEVREYSRRVGSDANNTNDFDKFASNEPTLFDQGFNSSAFYRSAFQPQVLTDDRGQKRVEMKLDVNNYEPNEIKVSVNGNDLIVQAEHSVERPPTSTSRAYFYKQITLPPNTDLTSLSSQYHPDGKLHISAKISHEQASIRYN